MSCEGNATIGAFVTLRMSASDLDPAVITEILSVEPTLACVKGARDPVQGKAGKRLSRDGWWFLKTDKLISSTDLAAHQSAVYGFMAASPRVKSDLLRLIEEQDLRLKLTLFWFGKKGAKSPPIDIRLAQVVASLGGELEADFQTASEAEGVAAA